MKKVVIEWHPYPEEKPQRFDKYLVTIKDKSITFTETLFFECQEEMFMELLRGEVMAWAEFPEPYREES